MMPTRRSSRYRGRQHGGRSRYCGRRPDRQSDSKHTYTRARARWRPPPAGRPGAETTANALFPAAVENRRPDKTETDAQRPPYPPARRRRARNKERRGGNAHGREKTK